MVLLLKVDSRKSYQKWYLEMMETGWTFYSKRLFSHIFAIIKIAFSILCKTYINVWVEGGGGGGGGTKVNEKKVVIV